MSVSVDKGGVGPHPIAVSMLMREFGFVNQFGADPMWTENLGGSEFAVNVLEPLDGNVESLRR